MTKSRRLGPRSVDRRSIRAGEPGSYPFGVDPFLAIDFGSAGSRWSRSGVGGDGAYWWTAAGLPELGVQAMELVGSHGGRGGHASAILKLSKDGRVD
jgi:hypothetical protein